MVDYDDDDDDDDDDETDFSRIDDSIMPRADHTACSTIG